MHHDMFKIQDGVAIVEKLNLYIVGVIWSNREMLHISRAAVF